MAPIYRADPGGVFVSDAHRRTLGHLGRRASQGYTVDELLERMRADEHTSFVESAELAAVLADLEREGLAAEAASGWHMTTRGFDLLTGPVAGDEEAA